MGWTVIESSWWDLYMGAWSSTSWSNDGIRNPEQAPSVACDWLLIRCCWAKLADVNAAATLRSCVLMSSVPAPVTLNLLISLQLTCGRRDPPAHVRPHSGHRLIWLLLSAKTQNPGGITRQKHDANMREKRFPGMENKNFKTTSC